MNNPSIGGKEQEPQSSDVPKELLIAVAETVRGAPVTAVTLAWAQIALDCIPPGWMKTEQGWVQMEWVPAPVAFEEGGVVIVRGTGTYRVKQPSEDHPAG